MSGSRAGSTPSVELWLQRYAFDQGGKPLPRRVSMSQSEVRGLMGTNPRSARTQGATAMTATDWTSETTGAGAYADVNGLHL